MPPTGIVCAESHQHAGESTELVGIADNAPT